MTGRPGFIPEEVVEEIVAASDILGVVSQYVQLTKKSSSNYFGLCPFHHEKTPSFSVSPTKGIFYCFGCHAGGNVVTFIQRMEGLSYPEALHYLADRAGILIPEAQGQKSQKSKHLEEILVETARYYYQCLMADNAEGKAAREYLQKKRGYDAKTIVKFGIGYADTQYDSLIRHLETKGFALADMVAAGIALDNRKDKYRQRIMFPIFSPTQKLIAFGGRYIGTFEGAPKYLNNPQTALYDKSRALFAIQFARRSKKPYCLLAEGYMDVCALYQAGFDSAVASCGTALTSEQARLMKRYFQQIILCYDGDSAGQMASERAIPILQGAGFQGIRVLLLPGGHDPDEILKTEGATRFEAKLEQAMSDVEFLLYRARLESGLTSGLESRLTGGLGSGLASNQAAGSKAAMSEPATSEPETSEAGLANKAAYEERACKIIAGLTSLSERQAYTQQLARELRLPVDMLTAKMEDLSRQARRSQPVRPRRPYTASRSSPTSQVPQAPLSQPARAYPASQIQANSPPEDFALEDVYSENSVFQAPMMPCKLTDHEALFLDLLTEQKQGTYSKGSLTFSPKPEVFTPGFVRELVTWLFRPDRDAVLAYSRQDFDTFARDQDLTESYELFQSQFASFLVRDLAILYREDILEATYQEIIRDAKQREIESLRKQLGQAPSREAAQDLLRKMESLAAELLTDSSSPSP